MGRCDHNKSADQRHFEFRGKLPKPWDDETLSVFGFAGSRGAGASGSYRKVISGGKTYEKERKLLHDILEDLKQSEGVAGLKRLHRDSCVTTPDLVARLDQYDLYRLYDLHFDTKRAQYFPQFSI